MLFSSALFQVFLFFIAVDCTILQIKTRRKFAPTLLPSEVETLKFVAVITRHGSRSPLYTFPNDPFPYTDRRFWPNGPTELSNLGKNQLYHTGQYLKARYCGFIDRIYSPNSSEVTYNPYNRDFMSSACLTAGMYPPVQPQVWNPALLWQPVIQSVRQFDVCDLADKGSCPKYEKLYNEIVDKFNENSLKHQELLDSVSKHTGAKYANLSSLYDVYDTLLMQVQNGYKLPEWTKEVFPFHLRPYAINFLVESYAGNKELIQLGAGPELKYIADMFNKKANGTNEEKKFYIESAHDCTLIALLKAFGNKDPFLEIQTGAYLLFELHHMQTNYIVKILYFRTPYDENPETVEIEDCPNHCTLSDFTCFVDKLNPPNFEEACKV